MVQLGFYKFEAIVQYFYTALYTMVQLGFYKFQAIVQYFYTVGCTYTMVQLGLWGLVG